MTKVRNGRFHELLGGALIAFALAALLALMSYSGTDRTWFQFQPEDLPRHNWIGPFGATLADALLQLLGLTAFLFPFLVALTGWNRLRTRHATFPARRSVGHLLLLLGLASLVEFLYGAIRYGGQRFDHAGGYVGAKFAAAQRALLSTPGGVLFSVVLVLGVLVVTRGESFARALRLAREWSVRGAAALGAPLFAWWTERRTRRPEVNRPPAPPPPAPPVARQEESERRPTISLTPPPPSPPLGAPPPAPPRARQASLPMDRGKRDFSLPPIELLNEPEPQGRENEQELLDRAKQMTEKFREFSIDGTVVAIHPGPVVTTFEFKPEAGVKYSKITGMTDDLSLALKAESVRIDRMPGRSTVGIEVPNRKQETIYPRELIGSQRFRDSASKLSLALGKDIHGDVYTAELDRMPHLLIAGATGAGKSVGLNGMIISLLYKATPRDLRFIMIDTKMIELGIYSEIPHLLIPVVTEPKKASTALQWAVREMESRYKKLASLGVRNIAQFNALLDEEPGRTMDDPKGGEPIALEHMPYVVIVIDEMADLMMVSSADVEESVMRLAQMARAVGLHLILATQRPSVDVITGTIKANFPSRIAFRVSQRVDSRTIIDRQGAEHLLGRGDMLLLPTGSSRVHRLHSGFITETEINRVTSFLKKMAAPDYNEEVLKDPAESSGSFDGGERDEMFVDAVRTVIQEGKCSITLIQRRLQLGYARAARIVDMMEQQGVVSPGEGSKPREVLVGPEILDTLEAL